MSNDAQDDSSLLVVLLETHPTLWDRLEQRQRESIGGADSLAPHSYVEQVLIFLNSFLLVNEGNRLAVFAVHHDDSHMLYMSPGLLHARRGAVASSGTSLQQQVVQRLLGLLKDSSVAPGLSPAEAVFSSALSRALCFLHKLGNRSAPGQSGGKSRILCLQGSPDAMAHYIPIMNAIFSAQRNDVAIDTCMVAGCESAFMQQAAHITGGIYLRPRRPGALLQYLLTVFAADTQSRALLQLPRAEGVDFRASCFCHKRAIDLGYVCSVCLSIFCESLIECSTCGTSFAHARIAKRKATAPALGAGPVSQQPRIS